MCVVLALESGMVQRRCREPRVLENYFRKNLKENIE